MMSNVEVSHLLDNLPAPEALSDDEFTEAWVPDTFTDEEVKLIQSGKMTVEAIVNSYGESGESTFAMTAKAIEQQRKRESLIKQAKTQEERKMVMKENDTYRINLIFADEEAQLIKEVLGTRPAENLLILCKEYHGTVATST